MLHGRMRTLHAGFDRVMDEGFLQRVTRNCKQPSCPVHALDSFSEGLRIASLTWFDEAGIAVVMAVTTSVSPCIEGVWVTDVMAG